MTINWEVLGRLTTCGERTGTALATSFPQNTAAFEALFLTCPPGSCTSSSFANPTPLSSTVTGILATVVSLPSTGTMPETASSFFSSVPSVMAGVGPGVSSSSESLPSPPRPLAAFHSSSESSSVTTEASEGVSASLMRRDLHTQQKRDEDSVSEPVRARSAFLLLRGSLRSPSLALTSETAARRLPHLSCMRADRAPSSPWVCTARCRARRRSARP